MAFFFWFITKVTQENHKKLVNTIIVNREKPKIKNYTQYLLYHTIMQELTRAPSRNNNFQVVSETVSVKNKPLKVLDFQGF